MFNKKIQIKKDPESQLKKDDDVVILEFYNLSRGEADFKAKAISNPFRRTKDYGNYIEEEEFILVEIETSKTIF